MPLFSLLVASVIGLKMAFSLVLHIIFALGKSVSKFTFYKDTRHLGLDPP